MYDITSENSFNTLEYWYDSIKKSTNDDIVIYLIGNKSDLVNENSSNRKISKETAIEFAKKHNLQGWTECSAKDNYNIKDTFASFYKSIAIL